MNYTETVDWLFGQFPAYHVEGKKAYKPGLDNIRKLAEAFGNPQDELKFVHIAGTNGKGSTANMVASILMEHNYKTGLFTSPHIFDFTERIRVDGIPVSHEYVIEFCRKVRETQFGIQPSFFEITWLMALCCFRDNGCEVVVAETGMGGRLDATNIVTPLVSVITSISLDHIGILGNTRTEIAREKAGIIKPGVPVVIGEKDDETLAVFVETAIENGSELIVAPDHDRMIPSLLIGYQRQNFVTVAAVIDVLKENGFVLNQDDIEEGIRDLRKNTGFFGRLEVVSMRPFIIADAAHNAEGVRNTIDSIETLVNGRLLIVYGASADKDLALIREVMPSHARYYFTTFSNPRSALPEQLQEAFAGLGKECHFFNDPVEALESAKAIANKEDMILILGSFFLLSDFFDVFFN